MGKVRTRFAPSPTGYMHIGNLRTALYAYLIAKKDGGDFILRIEDTDQGRLVEGATDVIYSTLKDCGLNWDEGPDIGGDYGPYVQSERMDNYLKYAKMLVENGSAYYCFCTEEELDARIPKKEEGGEMIRRYDGHCRNLSKEEVEAKLAAGTPYVIRQKMPSEGVTTFHDLVYGDVSVENKELEDQILIKSDGMPTYNFANVVDDHLMGITHVVRGNEYLSSSPKYNLLYEAFGWDTPEYVHCAPVMKDEHQKLSKRNGDASYQDLVAKGYLTEAVLNYIALLGWSPKGERELFTVEELIKEFDLSGISKSPAIFDPEKLKYINSEYIRALTHDEFKGHAMPFIRQAVKRDDVDFDILCDVLQPRTEYFSDIPEKLSFIDKRPDIDPQLYFSKKFKTDSATAKPALEASLEVLKGLDDFSVESVHSALLSLVESLGVKNGWILGPLRVAISGVQVTPGGAVELIAALGKKETISRIESAIQAL